MWTQAAEYASSACHTDDGTGTLGGHYPCCVLAAVEYAVEQYVDRELPFLCRRLRDWAYGADDACNVVHIELTELGYGGVDPPAIWSSLVTLQFISGFAEFLGECLACFCRMSPMTT